MYRIGICAAFDAGEQLARFICERRYPIEFAATCASDTTHEESIAQIFSARGIRVLRQIDVNDPIILKKLRDAGVDIVFLIWWPRIIGKDAIGAARVGWINLHPSFLPFGRGKHDYYWSIVEGHKFGVSLHFVTDVVDAGDVLFQRELPVELTDTGETLYKKSFNAVLELFRENYDAMVQGNFQRHPQDEGMATFRKAKEIEKHSCIELEKQYKAIDLLNIIRGRTFWAGSSAYFFHQGKKYYLKLQIEQAAD